MMEEIILNFVREGRLKQLRLGISIEEVTSLLNIPTSAVFSATRRRKIWEAADLKLSFFKDKLDIISINCSGNEIQLPSQVSQKSISNTIKSYDEMTDFLKKGSISYSLFEQETVDERICLKLDSGVLVYFETKLLSQLVLM